MGRSGALLIVVICLLVTVTPVGAAQPANGDHAAQVSADETTADSFDRSEVKITVYENGSARWTFTYQRALENDSQVQQFEQFAERFRTEETTLYRNFQNDSRSLVAEGRTTTNRSMRAAAFTRDATVNTNLDTKMGTVSLSFVWHGFAQTNESEETVVVGDVFEGGLYLGTNQSLVVEPGPNLAFESVTPNATQSNESSLVDSQSITWEGEKQFTDQRPQVVFQHKSAVADERSGGFWGIGGGDSGTDALSLFVAAGVLVLLLIGGVVFLRQRDGADATNDAVLPGNSPPSPSSNGGPQTSTSGTDSGVARAPAFDAVSAGSDSARVISLLRANDGQMRQSHIVDETGWSKSKVSMLLSEMETDGYIRKQRIGRENIITLLNEESPQER